MKYKKYIIDYIGLENWLINDITYKDFYPPKKGYEPKITKAFTAADVERFCKTAAKKSKITLDQFVDYGKPFILDCIGNDLSVCQLTRGRHKLPTGRVIGSKFDRTIIKDCKAIYGSCINGYWVIPDKFIDYI